MRTIPYFVPDITEYEQKAIAYALQNPSHNLAPSLEQEFKNYLNVEYAISAISGTAAFHLCLFAMNLKRGDKIICSVNCHPMYPEMIRQFDAEPIFVDIDEDTFEMSLEGCQKVLETTPKKKLRALIVSHIAGQASDIERFYALAQSFEVKIIEDCTMALGLDHQHTKIGNFYSYASIFSIIPDSPTPLAQAGILATNDKDLANQALLLRYHGVVSEKLSRVMPEYLYDVVDIGNKYNISNLDVALCLGQLRRIDYIVQKRREYASYYMKALENIPHVRMPIVKREHTFFHFIIKIDKNRDHFAKALKQCGVETGLHFVPLHLLTYYKSKYHLKISDYPISLRNYQKILSLPIYSAMKLEDLEYVCKQIAKLAYERM